VGVADPFADQGKRAGDGVLRYEVHLDRHALSAFRLDGLRQRRRIGRGPGGQHDEEALLGELLGDGAPDAPADAHGQVAVVDGPAVCQPGVAPVGLPLGGCTDDDGHLFTGWAHDAYLPFGCDGVATVPDGGSADRKDGMP
jgi:hypothetical protein